MRRISINYNGKKLEELEREVRRTEDSVQNVINKGLFYLNTPESEIAGLNAQYARERLRDYLSAIEKVEHHSW